MNNNTGNTSVQLARTLHSSFLKTQRAGSTGAENDLERATTMARQMVCMYGMSKKVGLVHCAHRDGMFLPVEQTSGRVDCSEATANVIDEEVKQLLDTAYTDAKTILAEHQEKLELVATELLSKETLDAAAFQELLGRNKDNITNHSETVESTPT